MSEVALSPTYQVAPDSTVKPEEVIEVLRQCFDPEIPVNIIDLGLVYDIAIKPERVDVRRRRRHRLRARLDPRAHVRGSALGAGDGLARTTQAGCGQTSTTLVIIDSVSVPSCRS